MTNFTLQGSVALTGIEKSINNFQKNLSKLKIPDLITNDTQKTVKNITNQIKEYRNILNSGIKNEKDIKQLNELGQSISSLINTLQQEVGTIKNLNLSEVFSLDTSSLELAKNRLSNLYNELQKVTTATVKYNSVSKISKTKRGNKAVTEEVTAVVNLEEAYKKLSNTTKSKKVKLLGDAIETGDITAVRTALDSLFAYSDELLSSGAKNYGSFTTNLNMISELLNKMNFSKFNSIRTDISNADIEVEQLQQNLKQIEETNFNNLSQSVSNFGKNFANTNNNIQDITKSILDTKNEIIDLTKQFASFFTLANATQLIQQAFRGVINTVKELDAVMTEAAVVTDYSVSDMWESLPTYTEQAKALGVATRDLYAATTLYFQQGLEANAAMGAGVETMKMARIAGMEAAEATDAMTSALLGFNMEVNETNAQRVNDVYSELAKITAADTEEIATAMSKTASIANSVGAEFENIASFLALGIESTRESADSLGTALKTILARFNELTKDPSEIGEVDGEIVDANRVEAALRSAGIALRDANGEFRNTDEVLKEVAQKWDNMTIMQQRYLHKVSITYLIAGNSLEFLLPNYYSDMIAA